MVEFNRRDFLRLGGTGLALGALAPYAPVFQNRFMSQAVHAASVSGTAKRLIFIFLRGGCDALNTVIPHGDTDYNDTADSRPGLYIAPGESIDLNGFAALHPKLAKLSEVQLAGDLCTLHKVAMNGQSRSHFSSETYWENGDPGNLDLEEGWLNRYLANDALLSQSPISGASIASQLQTMFKGSLVVPQFSRLQDYTLGTSNAAAKLIGAAPNGDLGSGLLGVFSRTPDASDYDPVLRENGKVLGGSLAALQTVNPNTYVPQGGATYPDSSTTTEPDFQNGTADRFFERIKAAVQLIKETDCRVMGIDLGGFDNHSNQGRLEGNHPRLLHMLAHAIQSIRRDLSAGGSTDWDDTLVVVGSEFARTSKENASDGTDHGHAGAMFVAGGCVNGLGLGGVSGVYNADPTTWAIGDIFQENDRYLIMRTDYRAIYAEIMERHLGVAPGDLDSIIPGWSALTGSEYNYLNFLP
ncbi:MAG: DUF1501 domain-containing protein [Planctomycetota bacterium]